MYAMYNRFLLDDGTLALEPTLLLSVAALQNGIRCKDLGEEI